ncbi:thiamine diphosphate-binding protein [Xylariales sp. PMI_506]|nr:thiamine diphosphate-binding protein [Xylariales sp. PMI_506]
MIPLARYLFRRLAQHNVHHLHGVPGDFTLKALDQVGPSGLKWVSNCNELNAGYAADGYARIRGLAALMTTYGVGELSAINAVAGSYSEHVPVVHIVGTPARRLQQTKWEHLKLHHTLGDGRIGVFREIAEKVTAAQVNLNDPSEAADKVDWVIGEALRLSLPVYVELPSDMVAAEVDEKRLQTPITNLDTTLFKTDPAAQAGKLLERLRAAERPVLLVDRGHGVGIYRDHINEFVRRSGLPTFCMPSGAGMVDNSLENYFGVHSGSVGRLDSMALVGEADLVLAFGPMFTDTQTLGFQVVPPRERMVILGKSDIDGQPANFEAVLKSMINSLDSPLSSWRDGDKLRPFQEATTQPLSLKPEEPIRQSEFYDYLNGYIKPHDTIILGNATPLLGARDFSLPPHARVIASGVWFSIGHLFAATQGVALAKQKGRTILIDGDGNAQMTIQELSTIIRERLDATIFIINNGGYAYERLINGLHESYNDLAPWRYLLAPEFFGAASATGDNYPVETHQVRTWGDLSALLQSERFSDGKGLKFVEVIMDKLDVPDKFRSVFERAAAQL